MIMEKEITIPKGFEATIDGNKIILKKIESEDEKIRKALIEYFNEQCDMSDWNGVYGYQVVSWLEKQGQEPRKVSIWKHWINGIAGNGEGEPIYLIKAGNTYNLSSCLSFECDYIELSDLDELMLEKRTEVESDDDIEAEEKDIRKAFNKIWDEKRGEQKLPIEKLPSEMKTIGESLGFTTQEECDKYNKMVSDIIMSDNDKPKFKVKYAGNEYNVFDIKASMGIIWYGIEDEPNHIDYIKADSCEIISGISGYSKPTDNDMKEALRTEYEKGRVDAIAEMRVAWSEEDKNKIDTIISVYRPSPKLVKWLKSIKERYTWKPSDEQITVLELASKYERVFTPKQIDILIGLKEQLKKLKE